MRDCFILKVGEICGAVSFGVYVDDQVYYNERKVLECAVMLCVVVWCVVMWCCVM